MEDVWGRKGGGGRKAHSWIKNGKNQVRRGSSLQKKRERERKQGRERTSRCISTAPFLAISSVIPAGASPIISRARGITKMGYFLAVSVMRV